MQAAVKCAVQHGRAGLKVTWLSLMKASSDAQELQREASLRSPLESCGLDGRVCEEAAHMAVIFFAAAKTGSHWSRRGVRVVATEIFLRRTLGGAT